MNTRMFAMKAACVAVALIFPSTALAAGSPASPWAQSRVEGLTPGSDESVELHNGSFHHGVKAEVPPFKGLEPNIALAFDSSAGNGFAGVGWSLGGFSVIERTGPSGHGSRACNASDAYTLDGEPLVECTTLGGTHCTKAQSFRRIQFDAASARWFVWDKDGTKRTYARTFDSPDCAYRYGLSSVEDTNGNIVSYSWIADQPGVHQEVYPATITYNGVSIRLFRELRPDPINYANGFDWTSQRYRLKSILVSVDSNGAATGGTETKLRAYKLSYETSTTTGRSRLVSIGQYGK